MHSWSSAVASLGLNRGASLFQARQELRGAAGASCAQRLLQAYLQDSCRKMRTENSPQNSNCLQALQNLSTQLTNPPQLVECQQMAYETIRSSDEAGKSVPPCIWQAAEGSLLGDPQQSQSLPKRTTKRLLTAHKHATRPAARVPKLPEDHQWSVLQQLAQKAGQRPVEIVAQDLGNRCMRPASSSQSAAASSERQEASIRYQQRLAVQVLCPSRSEQRLRQGDADDRSNAVQDQRCLRLLQQQAQHIVLGRRVINHAEAMKRAAADRSGQTSLMRCFVMAWHHDQQQIAVSNRILAAKRRLQLLKGHDMAAYLKEVSSVKSGHIQNLLAQTDRCLEELMRRLQAKCPQTAQVLAGKCGQISSSGGSSGTAADAWQSSDARWNNLSISLMANDTRQPSLLSGGEMRDYQLQGLRWMAGLRMHGLNGILADEMGLGKTLMVISLLAFLVESDSSVLPSIVIVPSSVLPSWQQEFSKWSPTLKVLSYCGKQEERAAAFNRVVRNQKAAFDILLTTYELMMGKHDVPRLSSLQYEYIIVDEAHRLKNSGCKLNREMKAYKSQSRLLLTGTPVQNNLDELWSLLNFILPDMFDSSASFAEWFACEIDEQRLEDGEEQEGLLNEEQSLLVTSRLHQVLRPLMLRRLKQSVASELPSKTEHLIRCQPSAYQTALITIIQDSLSNNNVAQGLKGINNSMMELRVICNHPLISRLHQDGCEESLPRSNPTAEVQLCGKMQMLDRILVRLHRARHKVLLFSTMTRALDVIEDYLEWRGFSWLRLDGGTSSADRGDLVNDFSNPGSDKFIFLLSVRAGGVGLNLQAADTVIMYDTDWNPQIDNQAQARAHRIGQTQQVLVLRLVTDKSVEEHILNAARAKQSIADQSITGGFFDNSTSPEDRRKYLVGIMQSSAQDNDLRASRTPDKLQLDVLLARCQVDMEIFAKITIEEGNLQEGMSSLASAAEITPMVEQVRRAVYNVKLEADRPILGKRKCRGTAPEA
ncbi:hypothetical protein WJX74_010778 [Apatococcus lobatus]|uniref:Uncharacterized protein n=1 Tax=Apatococcus lobatus TaxID=904363 RepID=A0AAW1S0N3_9CHLO